MIDDDFLQPKNLAASDPGTTTNKREVDKEGREKRAMNRRLDGIKGSQDEANELSKMNIGIGYNMGVAQMKQNQKLGTSPIRTISSGDVRAQQMKKKGRNGKRR